MTRIKEQADHLSITDNNFESVHLSHVAGCDNVGTWTCVLKNDHKQVHRAGRVSQWWKR